MAKLYILSGGAQGRVFDLTEERIPLGRAPDNMICLSDELVSVYHATFIRDGDGYRLRDLNSTNFTFINGARVTESKLNDNDRILFGDVEARMEIPTPVPIKPPPPAPPKNNRALPLRILIAILLLLIGFIAGKLVENRRASLRQPPPSRPAKRLSTKSTEPSAHQMPSPTTTPANPPSPVPSTMMTEEPSKGTTPEQPLPTTPPPTIPAPAEAIATPATNQPETSAPAPAAQPPLRPIESAPKKFPVLSPKPNPYDGQNLMVPQTQIDQIVFAKLQQLGIPPASVCSDATFLRRVYLDTIGTIPTIEEARAFLDDRTPNKRAALVDKLLERDEYADYWAMKWCDLLRVKSEFPINLWPNAVQTYHQWIRTCLKENRPYDRFARDLLTSNGSNFRDPPVNFYRAVQGKDPQTLAQTVALTFMGARADKWPKDQLTNLTTFFTQVGYKSTSEWKEEIVYFDPGKTTNAPTAGIFPDGATTPFPAGKDPRILFANWLITPTNSWFTRNIANRVWFWLLGRGIIHEPDDIRPNNPPVLPELLTLLERELIANKYNLKSLHRLILKSRAYQLSSVPHTEDPRAEIYFASYPPRRLEAEVLIDAINQITGTTEKYSSPIPEPFTFIPENQRSIALADGSISSPFLELFGRSSRATGMETERSNRPSDAQELHLLNSSHIQNKIQQSAKLRALLQSSKNSPRTTLDALYLTILSRYPTEQEVSVISAYTKSSDLSQRAALDIAWALLNTAEFQNRH